MPSLRTRSYLSFLASEPSELYAYDRGFRVELAFEADTRRTVSFSDEYFGRGRHVVVSVGPFDPLPPLSLSLSFSLFLSRSFALLPMTSRLSSSRLHGAAFTVVHVAGGDERGSGGLRRATASGRVTRRWTGCGHSYTSYAWLHIRTRHHARHIGHVLRLRVRHEFH